MNILLTFLSILVPLLVCIINFGSRRHMLWCYVLSGFALDLFILISKKTMGENNLLDILSNIFILLELVFIGFFYAFKFNSNWKSLIQWLTAIGCLVFIYDVYLRQWKEINTIAITCCLLFYLVISTIGYLQMFRNLPHLHIEKSSFFWFNTAFFIYSSSSLLIFLFADYLMRENQELFYTLWLYVYKIINIARYTLIGIGLGKLKKP
jgi:hypothetical protein